jgi:hypothetical protein
MYELHHDDGNQISVDDIRRGGGEVARTREVINAYNSLADKTRRNGPPGSAHR